MDSSRLLAMGIGAALVLVLAACATLFTGTTDTLTIETTPPGARVTIDGIDYGRTPVTFPFKRPGLNDRAVTLRLEGYEARTFVLQTEFNTVAILNLFSLPFWIVDVLTGSVMRYNPKHYEMELERVRTDLGTDHVFLMGDLLDWRGQVVLPAGLEGRSAAVIDPITQQVILFGY